MPTTRTATTRRTLRQAIATSALIATALTGCTADPASEDRSTPSPGDPASVDSERQAGLDKAAVLSPVAFRPLAAVAPVIGTDGLRHFAYELSVINQSAGTARLESVQAETPNRVDVGDELDGAALRSMLRVNGSDADDAILRPGGSGTLFLDLATDPSAPPPPTLEHVIRLSFTPAGTAKTASKAQQIRIVGVPVSVDQRTPVVVAPPLRGAGWVVGNGCCSPVNAHRGSTLAISGSVSVAQRFAIDFVQITSTGQPVTGDPSAVTSYPAFGKTVYAAAAGTVVGRGDGQKEQRPGSLPADATIQNADGNYLVIDLGDGRYAFYAHLQPGSIKVAMGDRVETGAELGLLGNTGNTDAPHLHFHIMDGPSPLSSNGLPFVLNTFQGDGVVGDLNQFDEPTTTTAVKVDPARRAGTHNDQMPLGADVVSFGG